MNIDERLEALTQSVELLATFHRDSDARLQAFENRMEKRLDKLTTAMETLAGHMQTLTGQMQTLSQIALGHEQRIQKLEN